MIEALFWNAQGKKEEWKEGRTSGGSPRLKLRAHSLPYSKNTLKNNNAYSAGYIEEVGRTRTLTATIGEHSSNMKRRAIDALRFT